MSDTGLCGEGSELTTVTCVAPTPVLLTPAIPAQCHPIAAHTPSLKGIFIPTPAKLWPNLLPCDHQVPPCSWEGKQSWRTQPYVQRITSTPFLVDSKVVRGEKKNTLKKQSEMRTEGGGIIFLRADWRSIALKSHMEAPAVLVYEEIRCVPHSRN